MKPTQPVHLRRLHYFALTQPQHRKPDGLIYTNTYANWKFLTYAFKFARYLKLLPYDAFVDRRNLLQPDPPDAQKAFEPARQPRLILQQTIETLLSARLRPAISAILPVHIEIWTEKSTAVDLLMPIARKYNVNIIASMGEISITAVYNFIKRVASFQKPVRLFYLSDFDPAGENMPISVARKIEFLLRQKKLSRKLDIKLKPLMLTRAQCQKFQIPAVPMPPAKRKKTYHFTRYHGQYTTELHALEVIKPGHIAAEVKRQIENYLDLPTVSSLFKITDNLVKEISGQVLCSIKENDGLFAVLKTLEKHLKNSLNIIETRRDQPWLFDSRRDYMTQLATYHLQKLR